MGKNGGARPGAGRKPGSLGKKTQELIARVAAEGISPMEVLLNDMRFFHSLGEQQVAKAKELTGKEQAKAFRAALELKEKAASRARDASPYVHPKLSNITADVTTHGQEIALTELE